MDTRVLGAITILLFASVVATEEDQLFGRHSRLPSHAVKEAKNLISAYEKIERYLETGRTEKVGTLMKRVKDIQSKKKLNVLDKINFTRDQNVKRRLTKALALFTSLPKAATLCNFEGYRILAQNYIAFEADKDENSFMIGVEVLKHYSQMHVKFCHAKYVTNFEELAQKSPAKEVTEKFATAQKILEGLRSSDCLVYSKGYGESPEDFVKTTPVCVMQLMRQLLLVRKDKTDLSLSKGDFETMIGVFRDSLKEFLIDPCWIYYNHHKSVFAPALYDAAYVNDGEPKMILAQSGPYGESLQNFRVCESIIKRNDYLQRMIAVHLPKGSS